MNDALIAHVNFTDGVRRPVFEQLDGHQYVVDEAERIYGASYILRDGGVR
jgi:hypothetical protein